MKVAILTQPLGHNYGGVLQNWALQQVLHRMGHNPCTINLSWSRKMHLGCKLHSCATKARNLLIRILLHNSKLLNRLQISNEINLENFISSNINITEMLEPPLTRDKLKNYNFDAVIVGSDQVWKPSYSPNLLNYFLDFLSADNQCVKMSYAASFGSSIQEYTPELKIKCSHLLKEFNLISVREKSAVDICYDHFGVHAKLVLDPTLLLDSADYYKIAADNCAVSNFSHYGICYFLNPDANKISTFIDKCKHLNIQPISLIPIESTYDRELYVPTVYPSVGKWLKLIIESSYVMTDSYHGTIFSIIFGKEFETFNNSERGSDRFFSLLDCFGLSPITQLALFGNSALRSDCNVILENMRADSIALLANSLSPSC